MDEKGKGLNATEVLTSRLQHGENVLTPPHRQSMWRLYIEKYKDPMVRILLVAAIVSLALAAVKNDYFETLGIIAAIILATTVGFYFERDAARRFDILTRLGEEQPVKVVRDGRVVEIARREVVVGDLVIVETGDEIPADGRLIEATDLQVDESSLTGEPLTTKTASDKNQAADNQRPKGSDDTAGTYPRDMLLRSAMVMAGTGHYVVTAVGDETEIGHVARQATELTGIKTPLNIQLAQLAGLISKAGGILSAAAFAVFLTHDVLTNPLWHSTDYLAMAEVVLRYFMMAVTLIVMAVPEGLPMAVTLALALNMRRMLKSNILVRKLQASETMGATTVICTDKTGTLTQNQMAVAEMWLHEGFTTEEVARAIALNTTAHLSQQSDKGLGNPTEVALLQWVQQQGYDYLALRRQATVVAQLPFSTERKYMATLVQVGDRRQLLVKGAPEVVMHYCCMDQEHRTTATNRLRRYQRQAMRTLVLAMRPMEADVIDIPAELPLLWMQADVGINDPIRPGVAEAIGQCRSAGIDVKVVTGDTADTAIEVARQAGIIGGIDTTEAIDTIAATGAMATISGAEFAAMPDAEAQKAARGLRVMYRARPSDKQRLVSLLQQQGEVVAVTGDGTNDAPALNHAHVGLSLGSGTSVAKQASDITLLDDSFQSIVHAVMWGRSLYKNIQRFIYFQLVVNMTALLLVLFGAFIGTEMPLTITQILWVNLIMDTFAAMALASLPPSRSVMRDKPRNRDAMIITRDMTRGILLTGGVFFLVSGALLWYFERVAGIDIRELTVFFTIFVMMQWWNLFNARALGSHHSALRRLWACRAFLAVLLLVLTGQWAIVTFGGDVFRTVPLTWQQWLYIIIGTSPVLWVGEIWRKVKR